MLRVARGGSANARYTVRLLFVSLLKMEVPIIMDRQTITPKKAVTSYKEVTIGKTLYRVTSVFSGEKNLGHTLEQLAVRRAMSELSPPSAPCGYAI